MRSLARKKLPRHRGRKATGRSRLSREDERMIYYYMCLMREVEDAVLHLYHQGRIVGGAYSGRGNEATAVGSAFALEKHDYLFPMHRDLGAHFVKGQTPRAILLQYLARATSLTRGRDGTGHYTDTLLRIYGNISHLGAMVPVACGVALASNLRKEHAVAMTYVGDGGANVGEVHEALAMASVMRLPLVLVIENNQYAYSTPTRKQFLVDQLSERARGYGIPGVTVDGTDVRQVYAVCREAVDHARAGKGPSIVESVTMRMHGHAAHDNAWYVPVALLEEWKKKDPVEQFEEQLLKEGRLTEETKKEIAGRIQREVAEAVSSALSAPYPPPNEVRKDVFAGEGGNASPEEIA